MLLSCALRQAQGNSKMLGSAFCNMGPFLKVLLWEWSLKETKGLDGFPPDTHYSFLPDGCTSQGPRWPCWQELMLWRGQTQNTETHTFGS